MTVRELIILLAKFDPNARVVVPTWDDEAEFTEESIVQVENNRDEKLVIFL